MRVRNKIISTLLSFSMLAGFMPSITVPVQAEEGDTYTVNVLWNDNNDAYGLRPTEVTYKVSDDDVDGDGTETVYENGTVSMYDNWTKEIVFETDWTNPTISLDSVDNYSSIMTQSGNTITKEYIGTYRNTTDDILVNIVWNDNGASDRPAEFVLDVTGDNGTTASTTISSNVSQATVSGIPFLVNGERNKVTAGVRGVEGYEINIGYSSTSIQRSLYVSFTKESSSLSSGYSTTTWNGQRIHVYKQSGNEKLALLTAPVDSNGQFTTTDIKNFHADGIKIKAIVNASYFNMGSYPLNVYKTTAYGRIQGMKMNSDGSFGFINVTTPGPGDGITGNKPYMDLVIKPTLEIEAGDLNSWDYHWGDDIGYPNEVVAGVSPAGVEILNGVNVDKYSPAVGYSAKITYANTQTALVKCDDGKFALVAVSGKLAPIPAVQAFANAYNMTELSVYDSGGSTQLGYRNGDTMQYPVYTGRTLPNVWILYEDESTPDDNVTVTINFTDVNETDTRDLSAYAIELTTKRGTSIATGVADTVAQLTNLGYVVVQNDVPEYVDGTETSYTVTLKHGTTVTPTLDIVTLTREINFIDENHNPIRESETQTVSATRDITITKDNVTGRETTNVTNVTYEPENFPSITVPTVDGYTPRQGTVPEQQADIAHPNTEYYVTYDVAEQQNPNLIISYGEDVLFNETVESGTVVNVLNINDEIISTTSITADTTIPLTPEEVQGKVFSHYTVVNENGTITCTPIYTDEQITQFSLTMNYSAYDGEKSETVTADGAYTVIVMNPDGTGYSAETYTSEHTVDITYDVPSGKYLATWTKDIGENQAVFTPVLEDVQNRTIHIIMDNVEIYSFTSNDDVAFHIDDYVITFAPSVTGEDESCNINRPSVQGKTFKEWNITEEGNIITFTPVFYDDTYKLEATIAFVDVNTDDPRDLSQYDVNYTIYEDNTQNIDVSDTVAELEGQHFVFVDKNQIPTTISNNNFKPSADYSGVTPSRTFTQMYQYSNPATVIGNGNMSANGCVPTSAAMLLSGYGITVSPETLGWYMYSTDNFNGSHGHGGTDLCWRDTAEWATAQGTPFKVKYLYTYEDFVDALKSGASVGMAVYFGGGTHARVATGYNNGTTTVYDPIVGTIQGASVEEQWNIRSFAAVDTLSGTSFAALDLQSTARYEVEVDHDKTTVESTSDEATATRTITFKYADGSQAVDPVTQTVTYATVTEGSYTDLVTGTKHITTPASEGYSGTDTFPAFTSPVIPNYTASMNTVPSYKPENPKTSTTNTYSENVTYTRNPQLSSVTFADVNANPVDLSEYTESMTISETAQLNLSSKVSELEGRGFKILTVVPTEIEPGQTLNVNVDHNVAEQIVPQKVDVYTRKIYYVYENGETASETVTQSLIKNTEGYTKKTDNVTGDDLTVYPTPFWVGGDTFAEVTSPTIADYTASLNKVSAVQNPSELLTEVTVTYVEIPKDSITVVFNDTDTNNPQQLESYSKTFVVAEGQTVTIDVSDKVAALEARNFKIDSSIPSSASYTGNDRTLTVDVSHKTQETTEDDDVQNLYRTIEYKYQDGTNAEYPTTQTITKTKAGDTVVTDLVTGDELSRTTGTTTYSPSDTYPAVTSPTISGFVTDTTEVPAENVATGAGKTITVTYRAQEYPAKVMFVDSDTIEPKDMSDYTINMTITQEMPLNISDTITALNTANFELVSTVPATIHPLETVTLTVKHKLQETAVAEKTDTYTRTINYVYADGQTAAPSKTQTLTKKTAGYTKTVDLVTNADLTVYPEPAWVDGDTFAEVASPVISGYKTDKTSVEALSNPTELNTTVTVTYVEADKDSVTIVFNDTDTNKVNLDEYSKTISVSEGETVNVDVSDKVSALATRNFNIDGQIPATVSYTGEDRTITVNVSHKTSETTEQPVSESLYRTIEYRYEDETVAAPTNSQLITKTKAGDTVVKDLVTNAELSRTTGATTYSPSETYPAVTSPVISGYVADKTSVEAENVSTGAGKTITVTYAPQSYEAKVLFVDTDTNNPQDLSSYNVSMTINREIALDISETVTELSGMNYEVTSTIPQTIHPQETVTVNLKHKTQETIVPPAADTYTRTINYVYEDEQTAAPSEIQTLTKCTDGYTAILDLVTNDDLTMYPTPYWHVKDTFAEVVSPTITDYKPDKEKVDALQNPTERSIVVTVTYVSIDKDSVTFVFNDTDANKVNLDEYNKTYAVAEGETVTVDLSSEVSTLEGMNFNIDGQIPATIAYTGEDRTITINVSHKTQETTEEGSSESLYRTIEYKYADGGTASDTVNQMITKNIAGDTVVTDLVNGNEISRTPGAVTYTPSDKYPAVTSPTITDFVPDSEQVGEESVTTGAGTTVVVIYSPRSYAATIQFVDTDTTEQIDLSSYTITMGISGETPVDITEQITALDNIGLRVVGTVPAVIHPQETITVYAEHKFEETPVAEVRTEYKRTIKYTGMPDDLKPADVTQTLAFVTPAYSRRRDLALDRDVTVYPDSYWENDQRMFPGVTSPEIAGYKTDTMIVSPEYPTMEEQEVTVTYYEYTPTEYVETTVNFSDSNANPQTIAPMTVQAEKGRAISGNAEVAGKLTELQNSGYKIISGADTLADGSEITIVLDHETRTSVSTTVAQRIRKINRVMNNVLKDSVNQSCQVTTETTKVTDTVTGEVLEDTTVITGKMPAYDATLPDWRVDRQTLPEFDFANGDEGFVAEETLNYTRDAVTVNVVFNDVNAVRTDVSKYNFSKEVLYNNPTSIAVEMTNVTNQLERDGYKTTGTIPETVDGTQTTVTINLDHIISTKNEEETVQYVRNIKLYNQTIVEQAWIARVTPVTTDMATGASTRGTTTVQAVSGKSHILKKYPVPTVTGYTVSPEVVEEIDVLQQPDTPLTQTVTIKYTQTQNSSGSNNTSVTDKTSSNTNTKTTDKTSTKTTTTTTNKTSTNTKTSTTTKDTDKNSETDKTDDTKKKDTTKKTEEKVKETPEPSATPKSTEEPSETIKPTPEIPEDSSTVIEPSSSDMKKEEKKKSGINPILLIGLGVLAIAGLAFAAVKMGIISIGDDDDDE